MIQIIRRMRRPESSLAIRQLAPVIFDFGIVSRRFITDDFAEMLVDLLQSADVTFSDFKYHDTGEGLLPEDETDSALGAPCGEARDIGTQTEGAAANIYKSVATHTYAGAFNISEHGLLNAAVAGVLMDRSAFAAKSVGIGYMLEFTYQVVFPSGS